MSAWAIKWLFMSCLHFKFFQFSAYNQHEDFFQKSCEQVKFLFPILADDDRDEDEKNYIYRPNFFFKKVEFTGLIADKLLVHVDQLPSIPCHFLLHARRLVNDPFRHFCAMLTCLFIPCLDGH